VPRSLLCEEERGLNGLCCCLAVCICSAGDSETVCLHMQKERLLERLPPQATAAGPLPPIQQRGGREKGRSLGLIWLCFHAWGPKGQTGRQTGPGLRVLSGSGLVNFQSPWDLQKISKALQPLPESHLLRQDNNRRERHRPVGFVNRDTPFISKGRLCAHNTQAGRLLLSSSAFER
jgi:hypothetical protein